VHRRTRTLFKMSRSTEKRRGCCVVRGERAGSTEWPSLTCGCRGDFLNLSIAADTHRFRNVRLGHLGEEPECSE
jgi:hypothetical protein